MDPYFDDFLALGGQAWRLTGPGGLGSTLVIGSHETLKTLQASGDIIVRHVTTPEALTFAASMAAALTAAPALIATVAPEPWLPDPLPEFTTVIDARGEGRPPFASTATHDSRAGHTEHHPLLAHWPTTITLPSGRNLPADPARETSTQFIFSEDVLPLIAALAAQGIPWTTDPDASEGRALITLASEPLETIKQAMIRFLVISRVNPA